LIIVTFLGPERLSNDEILENRILEKVAGKKELEANGEPVVEEPTKTDANHKEVV
jgi:hypothetical protein